MEASQKERIFKTLDFLRDAGVIAGAELVETIREKCEVEHEDPRKVFEEWYNDRRKK